VPAPEIGGRRHQHRLALSEGDGGSGHFGPRGVSEVDAKAVRPSSPFFGDAHVLRRGPS
jgi:hypothetical protein